MLNDKIPPSGIGFIEDEVLEHFIHAGRVPQEVLDDEVHSVKHQVFELEELRITSNVL
jgi:hypothetical protein